MGDRKVPRRIAQTVLNSLKGGVVPRTGLPYITVGRKNEIEALLRDATNLPWCAEMVQKAQPPKQPRCRFTECRIIS